MILDVILEKLVSKVITDIEALHQRIALPMRNECAGVFGVFIASYKPGKLLVLLHRRTDQEMRETKKSVEAFIAREAPGTPLKFKVTDQEFPTGGLLPPERK
jgi:hypothetical protein